MEHLFQNGVSFDSWNLYLEIRNWYLEQDTIAGLASGNLRIEVGKNYLQEVEAKPTEEYKATIISSAGIVNAVLRNEDYPKEIFVQLNKLPPMIAERQLEAMLLLCPQGSFKKATGEVSEYVEKNPGIVAPDSKVREIIKEFK